MTVQVCVIAYILSCITLHDYDCLLMLVLDASFTITVLDVMLSCRDVSDAKTYYEIEYSDLELASMLLSDGSFNVAY
jgi:hypothetical protein